VAQSAKYDLGVITKQSKLLKSPKVFSKRHNVKLAIDDTVKILPDNNVKYYKVIFAETTGWLSKKRITVLPKRVKPPVIKKAKAKKEITVTKKEERTEEKSWFDSIDIRSLFFIILTIVFWISIFLVIIKILQRVWSAIKSPKNTNLLSSLFELIGYTIGTVIGFITSFTKNDNRKPLDLGFKGSKKIIYIDDEKSTIWYITIALVLFIMPKSSYRLEHFIVSGLFTYLFLLRDGSTDLYVPKNNKLIGWFVLFSVVIFGSWFPDIDILLLGIGGHRSPFFHSVFPVIFLGWIIINKDYGDKNWNIALLKIYSYSLAFHLLLDIFQGGDVRYIPFDNLFLLINGIFCFVLVNKYYDAQALLSTNSQKTKAF
jgi:hypothetical protein